ncbi:MAG: MFS transporter [Anaerolineales bacterium]|nr:MFS transporter [Anaerolineales bacterium]
MLFKRFQNAAREYWTSLGKISHNARMYLLAAVFMAIALGIQLVLFNLYLLEIGYDEDVIGQIAALIALGVAIGGLPAGILYDRYGGKISFIAATIGMMATMGLMAITPDPLALRALAFIHGLANSIFFVSIFPFITDQSTQEERSYLYGLNLAIWSGFRVVGTFVAGYLPVLWSSTLSLQGNIEQLQLSLLLAALLGLIALIPLTRIRRAGSRGGQWDWRSLVPSADSRSAILRSAVILTMSGIVIGLTQPFYNVYFKRVFEADTALIGNLFALSEMTALISALLVPYLVARWGLVLGPTLAISLAAPLTLMMGLPLALPIITILFLTKVGLEWLGNTPLMNLIMEVVAPEDRGTVSGVRLVTNYGAQSVAGIVGGLIVVQAGYTWLFVIAGLIQLVFGGSIWLLFHSKESSIETTRDQDQQRPAIPS